MSYQLLKDFIVLTCWTLAIGFCIVNEKWLIKLERKLWRKIKKYVRVFIKSLICCARDLFAPVPETDKQREARFNSGAEAGNELYSEDN